jgi:hypothetical protein
MIFVDPDGPEPEGMVVIVSWNSISIEPANAVTLTMLQEAVDGYIERVPLPTDIPVTMWVNEDGMSRELPYNRITSKFYRDAWKDQGVSTKDLHLFGTAVFTLSVGGQHSGEDGPMDVETAHALAQEMLGTQMEGPPSERNGF